jgi:hypothetical protein
MEIETKLAADVIVARHEVARELEEAIGKLVPHWDLTCQNPEGGGTPLTRKCHEDRLSWDGRDGLPYCRGCGWTATIEHLRRARGRGVPTWIAGRSSGA